MNARGRAGRSSSSELEHEWQFDADDLGAVRDWLESRLDDPDETPDGRLALLSAGSDELTDVYLDTSDARLLHGGWSLRHRMARSLSPADSGRDEGERLRRVLTLKATRSEGTELRVRREIHELLTPIDDDALDTQSRLAVAAAHAARGEIGATMAALVAGEALRPFCLVVTARRRYTLESLDGPCAEIALDDANVLPVAATNGDRSHDAPPTVSRPVSLLRVEIELAPRLGRPGDASAVADRAAVDAFVERFARDVELSPAGASKLEIGLRAAGRKLDSAEAAFGGFGGDDDDDDDDSDDEDEDEDEVHDDDDDDDSDDDVEDAPDEDESDGEMEVEPDTDELDEDDAEFARTLRRLSPQPNLAADSELDELADEEDAADDDAADDDAADESATAHRSRRQAPKPGSSSSIDALLDAIRASRAASAAPAPAPAPEKRPARKVEAPTAKRGRKRVAAADGPPERTPKRKQKRAGGTRRTGRLAVRVTAPTATPVTPATSTAASRAAAPSSNAIGEIGTLALGADASASELAYVTLRRLYVALRGYEPGTRLGEDREELHQMRVATRRTRAALSFFADALPPSGERFNAAWRRLGQSLGAVRDLDVLALDLQARLAAVDRTAAGEEKAGMSAGLNAVLAGLERRRRLLRRRMIERLDRVKTARLFRAYEQFLLDGEARASEDGALSVALFLPERLRRRRRKLRQALRGLASTSPVGAFHAARIIGKQLRYAVEFSSPIYGAAARAYARRLVPLQDLLGRVQDASIAIAVWNDPRLASSLPSEGLVALGRLIEQARSQSKRGRRRVRRRAPLVRGKAWRALRRELVALADAASRNDPGA